VPLEQLHEEIHHRADHSGERWISWVALSTALLAVLAAIASLVSGMRANEAMMSQIESSDNWAYYQAKGIKAAVLDAKMTLSGTATEQDQAKAHQYQEEQGEIQKEARAKETAAKMNFHQHEIFARGVTMFQIAIAIAAISSLVSGMRANEAMMSQIESSDHWAYYQAKGIKAAVLDAKMTLSGTATEQDRAKAHQYQEEQTEIQKEARAKETMAKASFHQHEVFARGVTMFQIAIAIAAISALTKRQIYWFVSMLIGAVGCIFLALGFAAH